MSRSYRHNNVISITCSGYNTSEKEDKQRANRKLRSKSKQVLSTTDDFDGDVTLPELREVDEKYTWKKDGKRITPKCKGRGMHFTKSGKLRK